MHGHTCSVGRVLVRERNETDRTETDIMRHPFVYIYKQTGFTPKLSKIAIFEIEIKSKVVQQGVMAQPVAVLPQLLPKMPPDIS